MSSYATACKIQLGRMASAGSSGPGLPCLATTFQFEQSLVSFGDIKMKRMTHLAGLLPFVLSKSNYLYVCIFSGKTGRVLRMLCERERRQRVEEREKASY